MKWYNNDDLLESVETAPILIFNRKDVMHEVLLAEALGQRPQSAIAFLSAVVRKVRPGHRFGPGVRHAPGPAGRAVY